MITKPSSVDAPEYYHYYIGLVPENDLISALKNSSEKTLKLMLSLSDEQEDYRYAPEKWTMKQVLGHIIDTERIFAYRALRFSRLDQTDLPGYNENHFAAHDNSASLDLQDYLEEYMTVRKSTISLFKPMNDQMLDFKGSANELSVTTRGIGFMIVGHELHHCQVIRERYLSEK